MDIAHSDVTDQACHIGHTPFSEAVHASIAQYHSLWLSSYGLEFDGNLIKTKSVVLWSWR